MALLLPTLFQPLVSLKYFTSLKIAFRVQILKKYILLRKHGDFFTLLNKATFASHRITFRSVSQYYTV